MKLFSQTHFKRYNMTHVLRPRKSRFELFALALFALVAASCSSVQPVRVLEPHATAITGSMGGAFVPQKNPAGILPYLTAGVAHGVSEDVTVHGHAHLLMAAFGVAGIDFGASYRAIRQDAALPEVTVAAQFLTFAKVSSEPNFRLYPNLTANASWKVADASLLYTGTHATLQFGPSDVLVSPFVGYQFPVGKSLNLQIEGTWQAMNRNTSAGVFEGMSSINGTGSFGFFIGGIYNL